MTHSNVIVYVGIVIGALITTITLIKEIFIISLAYHVVIIRRGQNIT